jgi:carbon-monoxide dehydrogenase small subunit
MMSTALLRKTPNPTEEQVAHYLDGNLCRCTGYEPIVEAVLHAAEAISAAEKGPDDE